MSKVKSGWAKKRDNLHQMVKAFEYMPKAMAVSALSHLQEYNLEGNPINRITGDLKRSWHLDPLARGVWGIFQSGYQAPYAEDVMVRVSIKRTGKTTLELMKEQTDPVFLRGIVDEFGLIFNTIERGGDYKWSERRFGKSIMVHQ
jgi:hypothetical protein